ncbi:MAG: hypothetical protein LBJ25_02805 [Candidatus Margulisbacteria bacterium]|jgi:uncharacterized protein HemY|nr:hypothetical protein [Candidatus Margulisiibacteriota bacterium]
MPKLFILLGLLGALVTAAYDPLADILERQDYPRLLELSREAVFTRESAHNYYYLGAAYAGLRRPKLADKAYLVALEKPDLTYEMGANVADYFEAKNAAETAVNVCMQLFRKFPKEKLSTSQRIVKALARQNKHQEIINFFTGFIEEDPETVNPLAYYVGLGYYALEDLQAAGTYFQEAFDAGYRDVDLLLKMGELKLKSGDWQAGLDYLNDGIRMGGVVYTPEASTYKYLGLAYAKLDDPQKAAANFRQAITAGNREPEIYVQFAENALLGKDFQGILTVLEPRVAANSKNADYQYYLASACDNLNLRAQAIQYYQKALEAGYKNADFVRLRVSALRQQEEDE